MPRRPDLPCASCGKLMWRGSMSLPAGEAKCRPCRKAGAGWWHSDLPQCQRSLSGCTECDRPAQARGLCTTHYAYWYRRNVSSEWRPWISPEERATIYERDEWTCGICHGAIDRSADPQRDDGAPSLDHILPRSLGGGDEPENLRCAHRGCNARRGARVEVDA